MGLKIMQILTSHLKAVLLAAGKKDIRYYLNGVHVTKHHLVATDGHRMHVVCHGGDWPHDPVTIPRDACELAVKGKTTNLEITPTAIGPISYQPTGGTYPDYTRLLARSGALHVGVEQGDMLTCIQPEYLKDADAAIKLVAGTALNSLARIGGSWIWSNPTLQVVVMPFRVHATQKTSAAWSLEPLAC